MAVKTHSFLIVNPRSGAAGPTGDELAAAAAERGIEAHVLAPGDDAGMLARDSGAEILGAAGGDGSLAAVASAALETRAAFVCVPFGTRNHFARDIGLDRDAPVAALDAFTSGRERRIDLGRVGERLFVNNVSLGVYAGLVHRRERHRRRGEALARVRALAAVARNRHRLHARVSGEAVAARVLLVGNNRYELSLFTLGERERLDEGRLQLCTAAGLLPTTWDERDAETFRVELSQPRVKAAIDGEPAVLESPIEFASLPGALRVLVPERTAKQSPEEADMHDNPRASDEEQEQAQEGARRRKEEDMRYPSPGNDEDEDGRG
jgi:diacylglycerol kinase family enzyme